MNDRDKLRAYWKMKKQMERADKLNVSVGFSLKEGKQILEKASEFDLKTAPFVRLATLNFLNQEYIIPEGHVVELLSSHIRSLGNQINELFLDPQLLSLSDHDKLVALQEAMADIDTKVDAIFRSPIILKRYVLKRLAFDMVFRDEMTAILCDVC